MDIGLGLSQMHGTAQASSAQAGRVSTVKSDSAPVTEPGGTGQPQDVANAPMEEAVTSIKSFVQSISRDLSFSLDDSSGRVIVKVTDSGSGDVIRQIPSEDVLRLAESLSEARSLLFKAEA